MKGILPNWLRRSSQNPNNRLRKLRERRQGMVPKIYQLEDRVVLASSVNYFLPSPYSGGAYLPVSQVDRARVSFIPENADWTVDPSTFTALDVSITRNGGSPIDLSNGSPGQYKIGVVGSETYKNSFWLVGLPRVALATGDYQLSISGTIHWLDADGNQVSTENVNASAGTVSWQQRGGSVAAWGSNVSGQSNVPANLTSATNVVSVAAGLDYGLALKSDGTIQAWGTGTVATALPTISGVVQISGGNQFAIALKVDGSIQAWGTNTSGSVANVPTSGNYFAVSAGYATGGAIGDTNSLNVPTESVGTDGTLVTWGSNTDSTGINNSMYVLPDTIQGLVQASLGNDFMVGVRADGSFWGYSGSSDFAVPSPSYHPEATYIQAIAGQKSTGTVQRYSLTISNSYDTGSSYTTTGYGDNDFGTVNPANVTGASANFTSAIWNGLSANGSTNIANATSFNLNSLSQLAAGEISVIGLSSNSNQIKAWGYNGGPTPDGRVTGGLTYSASGSTVGYVNSGPINTVVQVMDLTAPTLSNGTIVPQAPTTTGTFPIVWQANFSEPIDLTTFTTGNCEVVYANGTVVSGFPVSSISLANGTTSAYNITVGANSTVPANFNGQVFLRINNPSGSTYIRDIAGNTLANGPYVSTNSITISTSGFSTSAGTLFNNAQWVAPGVVNYTLSFTDYANITQATNPANYDFTQLTGTLSSKTILSITANENVGGGSRSFNVQVVTGNPTPTSSTASFKIYLKPNTVQVPVGGSFSPHVDSNTVMVDNISPVSISSITPSTANGSAVASPYVVSTGTTTVYYKVSFNDYVQFQGAAGSISNFFNFSYSAFAGINTAAAFVGTVTNTAGAAYAQDWIVQVAVTGQGVVDMTVKSSYTSGSTTYGIVNPVGSTVSANGTSSPDWTVMTSVYTQGNLVNTYNSNATTTVTGLNPTNNTPAYYGAPAGVTFNTAQRSRVAKMQYNFYAPVANLSSTAAPVTGADFKLQVWSGTNATGSFVDYNTGKVAADQISIAVDNRWGAGATNYFSTYDLSFRLGSATTEMWTLPNGYYQIVMVNPSVLKNIDGVAAANGNAAYQSQFEYWRIFGNGDGQVPGGFPSEVGVTVDDYNNTLLAYANGNSFWAAWNLFSMIYQDPSDPFTAVTTDDYNQVLLNYARGVYLDGRVIMNL